MPSSESSKLRKQEQMKNKYQSWNSETQEKSSLAKHSTLREAIAHVECQIALHPRDTDDEGWRIQELASDKEMTLAEAKLCLTPIS